MRTTVFQHWGGHQKDEGREGDQRPLGEGLLRERERVVAKAAARNRECLSENVSALCAHWRA